MALSAVIDGVRREQGPPGFLAETSTQLWVARQAPQAVGELARRFVEERIAAVLEGRDEDDRVARLLAKALREGPEIAAIYNSGGCLPLVASAIRKAAEPGAILFIGHERTAESHALLREGVMTLTIDQAFELQARRAVEVLLHHVGHVDSLPGPVEIPFTLHTRENA